MATKQFAITNKEWYILTGLTDNSGYYIQSQSPEGVIWYTQSSEAPTENVGVKDYWHKFVKRPGENVYLRVINPPINIHMEEI